MDRKIRIRTVLYDDQSLLPGEIDILHTPALQRLYDLHQLGLTDRVFIDASHARLHHVVGVLEQVDKLTFAIAKNLGFFADRAAKKWPLRGSRSQESRKSEASICFGPAAYV